jgi:single-strand DNA-binding protein
MTAQKTSEIASEKAGAPDVVDDQGESANEVRLRGRLAAAPRLRELPSGDTVWNLRVVVERPPLPPGRERPRQRVDSLECAVWAGRLKKQVEKWEAGDVVDVSGALRRRFFRAGGATASRVEVELTGGRRVRRVTGSG